MERLPLEGFRSEWEGEFETGFGTGITVESDKRAMFRSLGFRERGGDRNGLARSLVDSLLEFSRTKGSGQSGHL